MHEIAEYAEPGSAEQEVLTLPFELRQKSRLRAKLASGEEVALKLPRGRVLRDGARLRIDDGRVVLVRAAAEAVSTIRAGDATSLARAAYHLGNRHIALQIGKGFLRYRHDHVLDDMVRALGLEVAVERAPFEPEGGAYGHGHAHDHEHEHEHG